MEGARGAQTQDFYRPEGERARSMLKASRFSTAHPVKAFLTLQRWRDQGPRWLCWGWLEAAAQTMDQ